MDTKDKINEAIIGSAKLRADLAAYVEANASLLQPLPDRYMPCRQDFGVVADTLRKAIDCNLPGDYVVSEDDCELDEFAEWLLDEHVEVGGLYASGIYVVDATACPEFVEHRTGKAYRCDGYNYDLELRIDQLAVAMPAATDGRILAVYYCKVIG